MEIIIYFIKNDKFVFFNNYDNKENILDILYNNIGKIWFTKDEIKKFKLKKNYLYLYKNNNLEKTTKILHKNYFKNINKLKILISKINIKIPLYDIQTNKIYMIYKENVYDRIVYRNYRLPNKEFMDKTKNNFLKNYNLETLELTYIKIFYYYSNKVGKNITNCVKPSFLSHLTYLKPYYTRSEIINMALNMKLIKPDKTYYDEKKINNLCHLVVKNDINNKVILDHQKYIVKQNGIHSVIYYSLNGAYFMNNYLRDEGMPKNILIETNIKKLWSLIKNAPAFDKSYTLYRFINSDKHLKHLKVNDIYIEKSFISTTRNPFYELDYKFGFILIKIKIPKNIIGVALSIETFSNFNEEEEILFPPLTHLKLLNKNEKAEYYHINSNFEKNVVTKYDFEYILSEDIKLVTKRRIVEDKYLDIDNLKRINNMAFIDKINFFMNEYFNKNYQCIIELYGKKYNFVCEIYDSTGAYEKYFYIKNNNGLLIYCQNPLTSNLSLTLEISKNMVHVNYYSKFSYSDSYLEINNFSVIKLISKIAYIFNISDIYIHQEYRSCKDFIDKTSSKYINFRKRKLEMYNYRKDFYDYFVYKKKRFSEINKSSINALFYYYQLDNLLKKSITDFIRVTDKDELYQIYIKLNKKMSFAEFYLYIIKNRPEYITKLEEKTFNVIAKDNPFINDFYKLDGFKFLYENNLISSIPETNKDIKQINDLKKYPKSTYRIDNIRNRKR